MKKYKYLEDVAIADIAFEAYGKNLDELFENSAWALFDMMADVKTVKGNNIKKIKLENDKIDNLLFDFLEEIVLIKDRDYFIFNDVKVKIKEGYKLEAELKGEEINTEKHSLIDDVKAITMHMFDVKKEKEKWKAVVVVDI